MQYCKHCKVFVSSKTDFCPLCHKSLVGQKNKHDQTFPEYKEPLKYKTNIFQTILNIIAPITILVTFLINLLTYNGVLWSVITAMGMIYVWIFGVWTFTKDGNLGKKIALNGIAINILLVTINIFGFNLSTLPATLWSITYTLPFIFCAIILANNIVMFTKKHSVKEFILSQFSLCFLSIGFFVIAVCGLTSAVFPAYMVLGMAVITLICFIAFGKKVIFQELTKKFHL